jgi:hypothetical protein
MQLKVEQEFLPSSDPAGGGRRQRLGRGTGRVQRAGAVSAGLATCSVLLDKWELSCLCLCLPRLYYLAT